MGDSVPRPTDDSQPFGENASVSQEGQFAAEEVKKGALETSSQQTSQAGYAQGQQYPPHYQPVQQPVQQRPESFNLTQLTTALPNVSYQNYGHLQQQRYPPTSPSGLAYPTPNSPQYSPHGMGQTTGPYPYQAQYYVTANQLPQPGMGNQMYHQGFPAQQHGSPYFMQPNQYLHSPTFPGVQQPAQYARGGVPEDGRHLLQQRVAGGQPRSGSVSSTSGQSSIVRGPPRKPRQTGHAIWIGNLPPQTELMNLVQHVCKEAPGLDSLFLISKSNCAFANFRDEATCAAALSKIHDSRFQNVGLVSRLRRGSVGGSGGAPAPSGAASLAPQSPVVDGTSSPESGSTPKDATVVEVNEQETEDGSLPKERFFVLKSLTVEDLEQSVRNGIWATQSHNEESLNKAYQTTDKVYLVFSVNKSGEYFGYARMTSPINEDPAAAIEFAPKAHMVEDTEGPKGIPTPATEFAPKGRIVDDSARGTIFWEVEREGEEEDDESSSNKSDQEEPQPQAWGKPFNIEWLSTTRLPFYRTRGLRNPWNSNREVKIARDGTELETAVGRKLIRLFHRTPSPVAPSVAQMHGMPMPMVGYSQMRPFQ